jgi:hypothetical protein
LEILPALLAVESVDDVRLHLAAQITKMYEDQANAKAAPKRR